MAEKFIGTEMEKYFMAALKHCLLYFGLSIGRYPAIEDTSTGFCISDFGTKYQIVIKRII